MITGDLEQGNQEQLKSWYENHFNQLHKALFRMQDELNELCIRHDLQPTLKYRLKSFESLRSKLRKRNYSEQSGNGEHGVSKLPTDLLGMRIVCPFIEDIHLCEQIIEQHYSVVEREQKGAQYSFHEFGYESIHYLVQLPEHVAESCNLDPEFMCEIQLRTILQDAWAEVEHELVYKADFSPFDEPLRRKLAALNANLSLADIVFQEIRDYQRQLNHQMQRRRDSFAETVEQLVDPDKAGGSGKRGQGINDVRGASGSPAEAPGPGGDAPGLRAEQPGTPDEAPMPRAEAPEPPIDTPMPRAEASGPPIDTPAPRAERPRTRADASARDSSPLPEEIAVSMIPGGDTVDNLLLRALNAHNRRSFDEALSLYTRILESESRDTVRAAIFMHRGMAHVARGDYASARGDFTSACALDSENPKGYYYKALVEQLEGNDDEALNNLNYCLSLDPERFEALLSRSRLHFAQGSVEIALKDCDSALSLRPDSDRANSWRQRLVSAMNL